jgi:hypothetical protein
MNQSYHTYILLMHIFKVTLMNNEVIGINANINEFHSFLFLLNFRFRLLFH